MKKLNWVLNVIATDSVKGKTIFPRRSGHQLKIGKCVLYIKEFAQHREPLGLVEI